MSNIVENREIAGQLLGCLIQEPTLIINAEKTVTHEDFAFAGHKILFGVLQNLYMNGIVDININEIANYVDTQPSTKTMFDHFKCMELYHNLPKNANIANYEYYFDITRKFTLLRELQKYNFDISHWYVPSQQLLDFELRERKMKELENATIQDIIHSFSNDINFIESKFIDNKSLGFAALGGDLAELMAELEEAPAQGFKLQADMINTIVRGGRPSKVYLYSAPSSVGKSRYFLGQAAAMSMPLTYSWQKLCWEQTGGNHKVLFITTELERDELQTMLLAYVTNLNEDHILNGGQTLNAEQREVLKQGIQIINYFQDNLYMLYMPSPNNEQIDSAVRRLTMVHKFEAVIFDYIHVSGDLLKEFGTMRVREDTALLLMTTTLKNLANELKIFIYTGTQLNAASQQSTREDDAEFGSESMIRGARAIADKVDIGMIARRTTDPLIQKVQQIIQAKGCDPPNRYIDVYKNRRGKYTMLRIWQNADLGTMKFHDLFVTDAYNTLVELDTILEIEEEEINVEEVLANVR